MSNPQDHVVSLPREVSYLAPDGSEIRLLVNGETGGLCHCLLPAGISSKAVKHRTVEELWYVLEGTGEIWRGRDGEGGEAMAVKRGDSLRIPVGVGFQFRASRDAPLELLLATIPPWPGPDEAVSVRGHWGSE